LKEKLEELLNGKGDKRRKIYIFLWIIKNMKKLITSLVLAGVLICPGCQSSLEKKIESSMEINYYKIFDGSGK